MKVAVTGADGQVGTNTVLELIKAGHTPRCVVEPGRSTPTLDDLDVEIVGCDILDEEGLGKVFHGCSAVVNAAGQARYWPRRSSIVDRVNIDGAGYAANAAMNNNIDRFVQIGSAGSFSPGTKEAPADETTALNISRFKVSYIDSKRESMTLIQNLVKSKGFPGIVVNPTFIFGSYCGPTGSSSIVYKQQKKPFRSVPPGGRNFVHARDVATGIVAALTKGEIGEAYILGNENLDYFELFSIIAEVTGSPAPQKRASKGMVKLAGHIATTTDLLRGRTPSFTYALARLTCDNYYYNPAKAVRELGFPQTPIRTAISDALEWYRSLGWAD